MCIVFMYDSVNFDFACRVHCICNSLNNFSFIGSASFLCFFISCWWYKKLKPQIEIKAIFNYTKGTCKQAFKINLLKFSHKKKLLTCHFVLENIIIKVLQTFRNQMRSESATKH